MSAPQVFNPRLVVGLIAAGIIGFIALMLLIAYGGSIGTGRDGRAHALSVSAVGYKGLVDLVGEFRKTYLVRRSEDFATEKLIVVGLEENSRAEDLARLLQNRRGPTLIILPKWITQPLPTRRGWVQSIAPGTGQAAARAIGEGISVSLLTQSNRPAQASGDDILYGLSVPVPASPQVISGKNVVPLVSVARGGTLVGRLSDRPVYIAADPDLFSNHALRDPAVARAALQIIEGLNSTGADGVDFDLTVNGLGDAGSQSLLRLAFEPPFLVMTLALFAAALLAGLHGAFRFGPVQDEQRAIAFGKAALVENSAGLIRLAGRETRLGAAYADVIRHETARTTAAPLWLQGEDLDRYLERLGRHDQPSFTRLADELGHARDRHGLMTAARALFQWKKDIIR